MAVTLQPFLDESHFAGAVMLVATPAKIVALEAIGSRDVKEGKPMRTDTVFWIASQTKPITAMAVMMLVDEGKIKLDDPVANYLPEFKEQWVVAEADENRRVLVRPRRPMQVRDLLTHTSGLPAKVEIESPTLDRFGLETLVKRYGTYPLSSHPGEAYLYSNPGINTAGRIVEVVSGVSFEQFLGERIFKPLKMTDTTFWPDRAQQDRLAKSYRPGPSGLEETRIEYLQYPLDDRSRHAFPGGGLFSTASDLLAFYRLLVNEGVVEGRRLLSAHAVREMTRDQSQVERHPYGYGLATDGNFFGHGGAYGTNSRYDRRSGLITIFLVQQAAWKTGGEKASGAFQKAAAEAFGASP